MDNEYYSFTGEKLETSRKGSFPIASLISVTEFSTVYVSSRLQAQLVIYNWPCQTF